MVKVFRGRNILLHNKIFADYNGFRGGWFFIPVGFVNPESQKNLLTESEKILTKLPNPLAMDMNIRMNKTTMITAVTDAMIHLTINFIMDQKGILISVMTTLWIPVTEMTGASAGNFVFLTFKKVPHFSQISALSRFLLLQSEHVIIYALIY